MDVGICLSGAACRIRDQLKHFSKSSLRPRFCKQIHGSLFARVGPECLWISKIPNLNEMTYVTKIVFSVDGIYVIGPAEKLTYGSLQYYSVHYRTEIHCKQTLSKALTNRQACIVCVCQGICT